MNICWEILGIEPTTDLERIRQSYLALLPSFHPESDPQGFKQLRQAYEEAQQWVASPAEDVKADEVSDEHEILVAFRELLASDSDRFQPSAWQKFIQQLNQCSMDEVDKLRWSLCDIAMKTETLSLSCLALLAQRLNWQPQEAEDDAEGEELEAFLETVKRGDAFDLLSLAKLPLVVQDQTNAYFFELEHVWRFYPEHFADALQIHGALVIPEDKRLHRKLLHWFSAQQWGITELVDIARHWQAAEPDNEDAHYYLCRQRWLCGEGESLLADLCDFWQRYPSTQADDLLLNWCRQHQPDYFPLVVMAVEARCMADAEYVPGKSARTRLLWADILHSGTLSPLGRSFVESLLYKRKAMAWADSRLSTKGEPETTLLDLYRTAEQVVLEAFPKEKPFFRLLIRLEEGQSGPLETPITQMLLSRIDMKPGDVRDKKELVEELKQAADKEAKKLSSEPKVETPPRQTASGGAMKIIKIVGLIALIVCALNRFFHFF
ncbi:J domain-containing protein [Citrobacter amalonaticus]|uniref:J domain-containing protein n=1 Tax=Citrobacter amalonaticus TaxID=35703 RepID=UPI00207C97D2|nr:J domain-containing protein [Citrobacter amalonaticus]MCO4158238.1 J domain-containing protein [Citrobacter amalonaticus]